ncbi:MAG TPA: methyltransferase [Chitinophagaceae bacterium]|nr:methyltransferase [Chitinophagaceae bacterium]
MKAVLKNIVAHTYKPLLERYLSKIRSYNYENIQLEISPQVFHPGFFFSTRLLLNYIKQLPMKGKSLLEPGCGSGLISIYAAMKGASVVSTDINPVAIEYLRKNSRQNQVALTIIHSDLFKHIPAQEFDIIAINPPYYRKQPRTLKDYAWYCGENGEYFTMLFAELNNYIHPGSEVYMVLFEGCDMEMINTIAMQNQFVLQCVHTHKNLLEENSIFKIEKTK